MRPPRSCDQSDKPIEVAHRAGRQVVQHHQAPRLRADLIERAIDPAVRIVPVARQRAPQHDGGALPCEMIQHRLRQQAIVEIAALSVRPEETVRVQRAAPIAACVRSNSAFAASGVISPNGSEWLQV